MKRITAGIIGCGNFAAGNDFPNFTRHPDIDLKWACDTSLERAQELARQYNVPKTTTDFNEVVKDPAVDLVKISTTPEIHLSITRAAAEHGVHVYCEKPMALSEREAWEIIAVVRKHGINFCVDHNRTHAPALIALKQHWHRHRKEPKHQPWRYQHWDRPPCPEELTTQFLCRMQDESASYSMAHANPLIGKNKFFREMTHWMDLACWLFEPQVPVRILAWGSARFSSGTFIEFSAGDTANIIFDCGGTFDYPKETYEITHRGALLRSLFFVENQYYGIPELDTEKFDLLRDNMADTGTEGGFSGYMKKHRQRVENLDNAKSGWSGLKVDKGWYGLLDALVKSIQQGRPGPSNELDGLRSIYLSELATRSVALGGTTLPVEIDRISPVFYHNVSGG